MKNFKFLTTVVAILFSVAFFTSCEEEVDPCEAIICQNDGVCMDGTCDCPIGSSGTLCETVWRDKIVGTHHAQESCTQGANYNYDIQIVAGSSIDKIIITNIYNHANLPIEATFTDANNFVITPTSDSSLDFTEGSGIISGNNVTLTVALVGSAFGTTCDLTFAL